MLKAKWYGTNSIKLFDDETSIMIDPFVRYEKRNDNSLKEELMNEKNIFITHGHLDHVKDLKLLYKDTDSKIYCRRNLYYRLLKRNIKKKNLVMIKNGDNIIINKFKIKVLNSKHIKFDFKLIIKTLLNKNIIKYRKNLLGLVIDHIKNPLKNEISAFIIKYQNRIIMVLGSCNIDEKIKYSSKIDYLFLAYQGSSDIYRKSIYIISRIKPKNVILTHFDNSFPPISGEVDVSEIKSKTDYKIIIPKHDMSFEL